MMKPAVFIVDRATNEDNFIVFLSIKRTKELKLSHNSMILIMGNDGKKTVCYVHKCECDFDKILMNQLVRDNLGVNLYDSVMIQSCSSIELGMNIQFSMIENLESKDIPKRLREVLLQRYFSNNRRILTEGNTIVVRGGMTCIKFKVLSATPGPYCIVDNKTNCFLMPGTLEIVTKDKRLSYDDIGGYNDQLVQIREMEFPLRYPYLFEKLAILPPRILMYGPKRNGKLMMAKALASETYSHFVLINADLINNTPEDAITEVLVNKFEEANKNNPSVICVDDLHLVAPTEIKSTKTKLVIKILIQLIKDLNKSSCIVFIGITSSYKNVNFNILELFHNSKADKIIPFGMLDYPGRLGILSILTKNMTKDKNFSLTEVANLTQNYTGADLADLCAKVTLKLENKFTATNVEDRKINDKTYFFYANPISTEDFTACIQK